MLEEKHVVTCFLRHGGRILLLRRSQQVGTYQGKWAGVSGYLEMNDDEQARTEIEEETGLGQGDIALVKKGAPLEVIDGALSRKWVVHPYLFDISDPAMVRIDWEHKEACWVNPGDLDRYPTVPGLKQTWERVAGGQELEGKAGHKAI
ncbi:MAG: NUDIX pyrophosphatase [Chloroflexota bacterium]